MWGRSKSAEDPNPPGGRNLPGGFEICRRVQIHQRPLLLVILGVIECQKLIIELDHLRLSIIITTPGQVTNCPPRLIGGPNGQVWAVTGICAMRHPWEIIIPYSINLYDLTLCIDNNDSTPCCVYPGSHYIDKHYTAIELNVLHLKSYEI